MPNEYGGKAENLGLEEFQLHCRRAFKTIGLTCIKTKMSHQLHHLSTVMKTYTTTRIQIYFK